LGFVAKKVTQKTEISVIILTRNRPQYLERSVRSIINQTFTDFELILINNGSDDNGSTAAVCEKLCAEFKNIRFISRENSNIGAGRNVGIDAAVGNYIAFADDDDYAYPTMLSFLYTLITDHQADISFCGSDKEVEGKVTPQFAFDELLVMEPEKAIYELLERRLLNLATPTKLFKKELLNTLRFSETDKYDDISATYKFFASALKIAAQGIPQYCFVRHGGNNSGFTDDDTMLDPEQLEAYFAAYRERTVYLLEKLPRIAEYVRYSEWSFLLSMYRKIVVNNLANCVARREYIERYLEAASARYVNTLFIQPFELEYLSLFREREKTL
jgi:glycosyltransferase involved in cell wall biosynthesis